MKNQAGLTLIGMILTMAIVIVGIIFLMRIAPVYIQHYSAIQSVKSLDNIPKTEFSSDPMMNTNILREKLTKQLYIDGIDIPNDKILIKTKENDTYTVAITYQVTKPLVGHMSLLFDFDIAREVNIDSH